MPMVCQNTNCREDGSIMVDGCGRISLPKCTLIEDGRLTRPYPDCCEMTYQCVDANESTYTKEWNQLYDTTSTINSSNRNYVTINFVVGVIGLVKFINRMFGGFV
ncbi:uncharacterized protein LOC129912495 [Episyrphus balteatus]|uniref:uncharacterized protein LOC129912495 n=1 Tax=Episyrphus balteatus TaxID=286459 RepID=UPI002485D209|nr:uncharacterized protein LOC129912495 [Episyrphus balteatus]